MTKRDWAPALTLFLLSPAIGELLSGSSPPVEFFNPIAFAVMAALYGGGAVLIRELAFRWKRGWTAILVMGLAYAIVEEGLMVKSFFDPNWVDIGVLGSYGRWAGVNWVWVAELMAYHAVFSITIPILLTTLAFPGERVRAWVKDRMLALLGVVLGLDVAFGFFVLMPYTPPAGPYVAALAAAAGLFAIARGMHNPRFAAGRTASPRPRKFFALGLAWTLGLFLASWILPATNVHPLLTVCGIVGLCLVAFRAVVKASAGGRGWSWRHQLALASGALSFFMVLALLQELSGPPNMTGMSAVALGFVVLLVWVQRRLRERGVADAV